MLKPVAKQSPNELSGGVLNQRPLYYEAGAVWLSNYRSPRLIGAFYSDLLHYLSVPRLGFQTYNLLILRQELCR